MTSLCVELQQDVLPLLYQGEAATQQPWCQRKSCGTWPRKWVNYHVSLYFKGVTMGWSIFLIQNWGLFDCVMSNEVLGWNWLCLHSTRGHWTETLIELNNKNQRLYLTRLYPPATKNVCWLWEGYKHQLMIVYHFLKEIGTYLWMCG